jgi:hypothetical protein
LQARHRRGVSVDPKTEAPFLPYFIHKGATWVYISRSDCPVQVAETPLLQQELPSLELERK